MFNAVVITEMKKEISEAVVGRKVKACLHSICRRYAHQLTGLSSAQRLEWLATIGLKKTYLSDVANVLAEISVLFIENPSVS